MQAKLTLTIEQDVIAKAKKYAKAQGRSLSNLLEDYLQALVKEPASPEYGSHYSPLVRSLIGAVQLPDIEVDYRDILEGELLKKYLS